VIRRATRADAAAIARVEIRTFRLAYEELLDPGFLDDLDPAERAAKWDEVLARRGTEVWVAEEGSAVVGYASVTDGRLTTLSVDPVAQGAGVGTALLGEAERAGARSLQVFEANGHARHFYEDRGWRLAGEDGEWLERPLVRYVK
jgi:ribosomal protein S18 acetylase RimI-like enzyme